MNILEHRKVVVGGVEKQLQLREDDTGKRFVLDGEQLTACESIDDYVAGAASKKDDDKGQSKDELKDDDAKVAARRSARPAKE